MEEARSVGSKLIVEGILQIASVSSYKTKYNHLLSKLTSYGLINNDEYTGLNPSFEVISVQPSNPNNEDNIIDFIWISNWLNENYSDSEFEMEFAEALKVWATD